MYSGCGSKIQNFHIMESNQGTEVKLHKNQFFMKNSKKFQNAQNYVA